jgi:hypothetical protein
MTTKAMGVMPAVVASEYVRLQRTHGRAHGRRRADGEGGRDGAPLGRQRQAQHHLSLYIIGEIFDRVYREAARAIDKGALGSLVVTGATSPDIFRALTPAAGRASGH